MATEQSYIAHGLIEVERRYLLLQRRVGRYLGGLWDIPGGTVEAGESCAAAAVRECFEETGMACGVGEELSHFENMDTEARSINFHTITFRLHPTKPNQTVRISHEHQAFVWATAEEASSLDLVWHVVATLGISTR